MSLFDRYSKLRESLKSGRLHTDQKEILVFLKGHVTRDDLPGAIVEAAGEEELRSAFRFAAEKKMRVAVESGVVPVTVHQLKGQMLIVTTHLSGAPVIHSSRQLIRVEAGVPAEALAVDLNRAGLRWLPLWPPPAGRSVGELFAGGREGLRNWSGGGTLAHVREVEWIGYDGHHHVSGVETLNAGPDVSGCLFGSRGRYGVITALELALEPIPQNRTVALFELPDVHAAVELMAQLKEVEPVADAVVYFGETATRLIREGNDNTLSNRAIVSVFAEWPETVAWPPQWNDYAEPRSEEFSVNALWQDVLRMPRTAARLHPEKLSLRLCLPGEGLPALEAAAQAVSHDASLPIALWGTVEAGCVHTWILLPDSEQRTLRRAEEAMKDLYKAAIAVGGAAGPGEILPFDATGLANSVHPLIRSLQDMLAKRCDPEGLHVLSDRHRVL